jgi:hypothetical protein
LALSQSSLSIAFIEITTKSILKRVDVLKMRLAKGEITIEEYKRFAQNTGIVNAIFDIKPDSLSCYKLSLSNVL